jgi:hypothetical protein
MRTMVALVVLLGSAISAAPLTSSENLSCTATAAGGLGCDGIGVVPEKQEGKRLPKLFLTHFILEPGAALDQPSSSSDCLLVGINGGDLLNEKAPFLLCL